MLIKDILISSLKIVGQAEKKKKRKKDHLRILQPCLDWPHKCADWLQSHPDWPIACNGAPQLDLFNFFHIPLNNVLVDIRTTQMNSYA